MQHSLFFSESYFFPLIHQPLNYVMLCALLIWFILQTHRKKKEKKNMYY